MDISNLTADDIIERLFELEKELEGAKELGRQEERAKPLTKALEKITSVTCPFCLMKFPG